ncbi:MAG: HD domain-containing protein [Candidatus Omnitrophica bacterium]|nr:HD domain-containing protein [Candidatus Omnitrophota bacterium]
MKKAVKVRSFKKALDFISEAGMLKQLKRSGWSVLGIKDAESVAEHSFRCAVIGYVLACMEKASSYKVLLMTLFNDMHEARITDLHKMAQRYIEVEGVEDKVFYEQVNFLPSQMEKELRDIRKAYRNQKTKESIIARDADILECLIQAKEYQGHGFLEAGKFMKKAPFFLMTRSARRLWGLAKKTDLNQWWVKLSEFKR